MQTDLLTLGEEASAEARERLVEGAEKLRAEAEGHGFVSFVAVCDQLVAELRREGVRSADAIPLVRKADDVLKNTRALSVEVATAALWPYFLDEAKGLLRGLAGKISKSTEGSVDAAGENAVDVTLLAAAARSFGLPTFADLVLGCHRTWTENGLGARTVLNTLDNWLTDARNLVEMTSRPELDIDLLGCFQKDARALVDRLAISDSAEIADLVRATIACARRHRFRVVQETFESVAGKELEGGLFFAGILRQHLDAYENIRHEILDNEAAEHLLLVHSGTPGVGEQALEDWLMSASRAGLKHLTAYARSLPPSSRVHLLEDIRHFQVVIPATRGSKTGQPVQRVLEGRISALRDSLRGLRQAVAHAHDDRESILPPLRDLEKAVVHLTTSSLGDVLAPVASTASDLAKERGKPLEEISLKNLDFFLDPRVMQKIRGAVVHAVRNAVDHGLETSDVRTSTGKPPRGKIFISAQEHDGWIDLGIEDDGRGVDTARVKEIARSRGLIDAERASTLTTEEIHDLLFMPGFSTAASVSSVSGRGVGMDAIRSIARELGGDVKLSSTLGRGSLLTMHFPVRTAPATADVRPQSDGRN